MAKTDLSDSDIDQSRGLKIGEVLSLRRIKLQLDKPTDDGDTVIPLLMPASWQTCSCSLPDMPTRAGYANTSADQSRPKSQVTCLVPSSAEASRHVSTAQVLKDGQIT